VLDKPRNARERALVAELDRQAEELFAPLRQATEAATAQTQVAIDRWRQFEDLLLNAEFDRLPGVQRGDNRRLALALIIERRRIKDKPISKVHVSRGRPHGARKKRR